MAIKKIYTIIKNREDIIAHHNNNVLTEMTTKKIQSILNMVTWFRKTLQDILNKRNGKPNTNKILNTIQQKELRNGNKFNIT